MEKQWRYDLPAKERSTRRIATACQPHSQSGSSSPTDLILPVGTLMTVDVRLRGQWLKGKSPHLTVRHCLILAPETMSPRRGQAIRIVRSNTRASPEIAPCMDYEGYCKPSALDSRIP